MRLIAATTNSAKVSELGRLVKSVATVVPLPSAVAAESDAEPVGPSLEAIAEAKAVAASVALGDDALIVASDGGLLVPALGEAWDPWRTRRFAGAVATNAARADALLRLAAHLHSADRRIAWREAVAVARAGVVLAAWVADSTPGELARDYDNADIVAGNGFWLPALWRCPEFGGRRLASLTPDERATRDDHWARLGRELRLYIRRLAGERPVRAPVTVYD